MTTYTPSVPKVLVCQRGSRHRYAIPRLFHEAGMLAALYTDSTALSRMGRLAKHLDRRLPAARKIHALCGRVPAGIPPEKIRSFDRLLYTSVFRGHLLADLSPSYKRSGLQGADVIYSMYGEEFPFLEWAKAQGCQIVVDVFIHPGTFRIVETESERFSGSHRYPRGLIEGHLRHSERTFALADLLLCPSGWVASGVAEMFPDQIGKIRIVPYGSSVERADSINPQPESGRILFAGREALRKGLHHLADAARIIRAGRGRIDVRVAGVTADQLGWMPHAGELNCLGKLPMDRMKDEFRQADLFVLPSLSEGQAGVVLEAMACGCPVIATRESGIDFEEGCGVTVPVCDPAALADAIQGVVGDRQLRNRLAEGALRQSALYSTDAWRQRLESVAREVSGAS